MPDSRLLPVSGTIRMPPGITMADVTVTYLGVLRGGGLVSGGTLKAQAGADGVPKVNGGPLQLQVAFAGDFVERHPYARFGVSYRGEAQGYEFDVDLALPEGASSVELSRTAGGLELASPEQLASVQQITAGFDAATLDLTVERRRVEQTLAETAQQQQRNNADAATIIGRGSAPGIGSEGLDGKPPGLYNVTAGPHAGEVWEVYVGDGGAWIQQRRADKEAASVPMLEQATANLKTGAIDALAQAQPVQAGDIASAGNNNYRWLAVNSLPVQVNLSQANQQASTSFLASYRVNGQGFTTDLLGREMVGEGVAPETTVVRVLSETELWLNKPAAANGASASVRFREQRWGDKIIPHSTLDGSWHIDDPTGEEIVRAKGFGFLPGNDKASNKAALERTLLYMYVNRRYHLRLPGGVYPCADGIALSPNIRVESEGLTILDPQGNSDVLFLLGDSITQTPDQTDQQFTQNVAGGMHGIIFRSMGAQGGKGIGFGNKSSATATAASGYPLKQCGFQNLSRGVEFYANNWCIDGENCFFQGNNAHIEHIGGNNSGENLIWRASHFSGSTEWAIRLSGTGCRFLFQGASFDYNRAGILFGGTGYSLILDTPWIEYDTGNYFLGNGRQDDGKNSVRLRNPTFIRGSGSAGGLADNNMGPIPIIIDDPEHWVGAKQEYVNGPRVVTIPEGQGRAIVPMIWVSEANPPRVTPLGQPGGWWWVECPEAKAGVGHDSFVLALQNPAPSGGARFSVQY